MSHAIEVKHVTKEYRLGTLESVGRRVVNRVRRLTGRPVEERPLLKALDDVTFTVAPGEVVGIIGHNGAGKSTLLKIISGVSTPTRGKVKVRGRIAPLIEVGAGFVENFTGRENLYLNGTILGLSRQQITAKLDEIVSFAGMEAFIDTPIKRYSSGMKIKLAFSLATSLESEILVIDEVLAVGDVAFARKSIRRMEQLINDEGRTVLIVGHNIRQLERICSRMMLLRQGRVEVDGEPGVVSKRFLDETTLGQISSLQKVDNTLVPIHDTNEIQMLDIRIDSPEERDGVPVCPLFSDIKVTLSILALQDLDDVELNVGLHTPEMVFILKSSNLLSTVKLNLRKGLQAVTVTLPGVSLVPGTYGVGLSLFDWARRKVWVGTSLRWLLVETDTATAARLPQSTLGYVKAGFDLELEREVPADNRADRLTATLD